MRFVRIVLFLSGRVLVLWSLCSFFPPRLFDSTDTYVTAIGTNGIDQISQPWNRRTLIRARLTHPRRMHVFLYTHTQRRCERRTHYNGGKKWGGRWMRRDLIIVDIKRNRENYGFGRRKIVPRQFVFIIHDCAADDRNRHCTHHTYRFVLFAIVCYYSRTRACVRFNRVDQTAAKP